MFASDPELMITIYCAVHLIGMTSTCTNPVLYAFFNDNIRSEFEFVAELLMPHTWYRSQNTSQKSLRSTIAQNNYGMFQKINPRRDTEEKLILPIFNITPNENFETDLAPTVHKSDEDCDECFPNFEKEELEMTCNTANIPSC